MWLKYQQAHAKMASFDPRECKILFAELLYSTLKMIL